MILARNLFGGQQGKRDEVNFEFWIFDFWIF